MEKTKFSRKILIELEKKKVNPEQLFDDLVKIGGVGESNNKELAIQYVTRLNSEYKLDILLLAKQAIESGLGWYRILDLIVGSIHKIKFELESLSNLLELLYQKSQGDLGFGKQYDIANNIATHLPKKAFELIEKLLGNPKPYIIGNLTTLIIRLFTKHPTKVWKMVFDLVNHENVNIKKAAIIGLGSLEYKIPRDRLKLNRTIKKLQSIKSNKDKNFDEVLLISFSKMTIIYPEATNQILEYSQKRDGRIQYQLASILYRNIFDHHNEKWFKESLINLTRVSCKHKGTLNEINLILTQLINEKSAWEIVTEFIITWGINSDFYKSKDEKITEIFNSTFYKFIDNKEELQKLLTQILNNDNYKAHALIKDIASKLTQSNKQKIDLDLSILNKLELSDLVYVCRKILGYIYQSDLPLFLIISILRKDKIDIKIQKLVFEVIVSYIGRDYTHTTIQNLKGMKKQKLLNRSQVRVANLIIKRLENYQKTLNALPNLKELSVSIQKKYRIDLAKNKVMGNVMSNINKSSIISQIAQKVPLKYGTAWFGYNNGDIENLRYFRAFHIQLNFQN